MRKTLFALAAAAMTALPAWAEDTPDPEALMEGLRSLAGDWRGVLAYRDYGTGNREEIGQAMRVTVSPDGAFVSFEGQYTDPGFDVYILTVATMDPESGALVESYHRDQSIQLDANPLVGFETTDEGWIAVMEREDLDGGVPSRIRRTFTLAGDTFTQRRDVAPLGAGDDAFQFRNENVVTRSDEPVTFGDFRQAPDAEAGE